MMSGHPQPIGASGAEVPIDQIRRHAGSALLARGGLRRTPAAGARDPGTAHQAPDPLRADPLAAGLQLGVDPRPSVHLAVGAPDLLDPLGQVRIPPRSCRRSSTHPCVVAAGGETQHPTHGAHRPGGLIRLHELESLSGIASLSRANQAAARFRMSRSVRSCLFSRRSRRSSSRLVGAHTVVALSCVALTLGHPVADGPG